MLAEEGSVSGCALGCAFVGVKRRAECNGQAYMLVTSRLPCFSLPGVLFWFAASCSSNMVHVVGRWGLLSVGK